MHIVITGANGFVGQTLVQRLLSDARALPGWTRLTLLDLAFEPAINDPRVRCLAGDISDPALIADALDAPVQVLFHLASVPGGLAEREYALGRRVNLDATLTLLEKLKDQPQPARVVFASTVAVYGSALPLRVDEHTPLRPHLSYGAQKLMGEILVDDFSRRGWIDGISLRLPGIVARPPQPSGLLSAFMSDVFWKLAAGEPFICPVSGQATAWWMSAARCVDNLLHAACLPGKAFEGGRSFALPVLHLSMSQVIDALGERFGQAAVAQVRFDPQPALEATFGRYPPLDSPSARALGFTDDGDVAALVLRTLNL